jgi:transposase
MNASDLVDANESLKKLLVQRDAEIVLMRLMLEKLKLQIARYKRDKFGASSERLAQLGQLELLVEELETGRAEMEALVPAAVADSPASLRKPVRKPLPEHLPRETVTHQAACTCAGCGGALRFIGEDVAEVLEIVPERFKVIRDLASFSRTSESW